MDRQTVLRFQAGEDDAFTDLYARYFDPIYRYLCVGLGNEHDAEDAVQQVFLNVYRALPRYDPARTEPLRAWLFAIARNEMISTARTRRRVEPIDPVRVELECDARTRYAPRSTGLSWIEDAALLAAVERLATAQRCVIALRYMIGLDIAEIAAVLDRSPHAVRQLHHRALRALERQLAQQQATATRILSRCA